MSYYRQAKLWLIGQYPHLRGATKHELLKKGKTLEKHCIKREMGGFVSKAPSCKKEDLSLLMCTVLSNALSAKDYQDAALLCLMWHCFGRASNLGFVQKPHLSVSSTGVFYVRLLRVKTSQEQGLTLEPDRADFLTCPLHALAVALAITNGPATSLLSQLPALVTRAAVAADPAMPLQMVLDADVETPQSSASAPTAAQASKATVETGIHGYVNRLLRRLKFPPRAAQDLTSHSFRRGGAQHANSDEKLAPQWIFDRGAWNLSTTNKGFAYVFNTPREDKEVARVLSGWASDAIPPIADVAALDHATQAKLFTLQALLFGSCTGHADERLNVGTKVLNVLTSYLVMYFPLTTELNEHVPIVRKLEDCAGEAGIPMGEILA